MVFRKTELINNVILKMKKSSQYDEETMPYLVHSS